MLYRLADALLHPEMSLVAEPAQRREILQAISEARALWQNISPGSALLFVMPALADELLMEAAVDSNQLFLHFQRAM